MISLPFQLVFPALGEVWWEPMGMRWFVDGREKEIFQTGVNLKNFFFVFSTDGRIK